MPGGKTSAINELQNKGDCRFCGSAIALIFNGRDTAGRKVAGKTAPYTYLGTANYVSHEGSRPMNITWRLDRPIPAKFLKKTNKLVVG